MGVGLLGRITELDLGSLVISKISHKLKLVLRSRGPRGLPIYCRVRAMVSPNRLRVLNSSTAFFGVVAANLIGIPRSLGFADRIASRDPRSCSTLHGPGPLSLTWWPVRLVIGIKGRR